MSLGRESLPEFVGANGAEPLPTFGDLVQGEPLPEQGVVSLSSEPGWGITLGEGAVERPFGGPPAETVDAPGAPS